MPKLSLSTGTLRYPKDTYKFPHRGSRKSGPIGLRILGYSRICAKSPRPSYCTSRVHRSTPARSAVPIEKDEPLSAARPVFGNTQTWWCSGTDSSRGSTLQPLVSVSGDTLAIHHLDVTDDVTASYIAGLELTAQPSGVVHCLQLGARALTFAGDQTGATLLAETLKTSAESTKTLLDHVSKTAQQSVAKSAEELPKRIHHEIEQLRKELEKTLDPANTQSIIGRFRGALIDDYRKVTGKVREDLDLGNPLSPLSALRTEMDKKSDGLSKQLTQLLEQNAAKAAASAERSKSTRKGGDFETALEDFLTAESRPRKDLVRRTSTEPGLDGNLVGDFVIEINPSEASSVRLVAEAKNAHKSTAGLVRELDKAMKNRGALFGISVITDPSAITQAIVPYGDDKLLVRVSSLPDAEGWDMLALTVALEGARWKAIMSRSTGGQLDINRIKADLDAAFHIMNRVSEVKKRITSGKTHLDGIAEYVDDLRRDLVTVLQRLRDTVTAPTSKPKVA